ncbi:unnamed protein product [Rotaria sp. Silwood2]|nr:unnamed protein product [Rotaria sp. Silwood2]
MPNIRHQPSIIEHLHNVIQQHVCRGLRFGRKKPRNNKRKISITENQYYFLKQNGVRGDVYNRNDVLTRLLQLKLNLRMMKDLECECRNLEYLVRQYHSEEYETMSGEKIRIPSAIKLYIKFTRVEHKLSSDGQRKYSNFTF